MPPRQWHHWDHLLSFKMARDIMGKREYLSKEWKKNIKFKKFQILQKIKIG